MAWSRSTHQTITLGLMVLVMAATATALISLNSRQRVYNAEEATTATSTKATGTGQRTVVDDSDKATGRYTMYRPELLDDAGYERSILFFTASHEWCGECVAFEQAIIADGVPEGVQILTVDFETADELKKQYQITVQTTFVEIDGQGQLISSWVGFAQEKSLTTVLNGLNTTETEG